MKPSRVKNLKILIESCFYNFTCIVLPNVFSKNEPTQRINPYIQQVPVLLFFNTGGGLQAISPPPT